MNYCLFPTADGILTKLLTESDLKEVYGQMYPQMLKWRPIGLRLDLSAYILDNIGDQYRKNERRLEMVLLEWLRRRKFHPSWQSLIDALNHHTVNGQGLADEIREYVLPKTTEGEHHSPFILPLIPIMGVKLATIFHEVESSCCKSQANTLLETAALLSCLCAGTNVQRQSSATVAYTVSRTNWRVDQ